LKARRGKFGRRDGAGKSQGGKSSAEKSRAGAAGGHGGTGRRAASGARPGSKPGAQDSKVQPGSVVEGTVTLTDGLLSARRCTCSYCRMRGAIAVSADLDDINITQGGELLSLYQFNTNTARNHRERDLSGHLSKLISFRMKPHQ